MNSVRVCQFLTLLESRIHDMEERFISEELQDYREL